MKNWTINIFSSSTFLPWSCLELAHFYRHSIAFDRCCCCCCLGFRTFFFIVFCLVLFWSFFFFYSTFDDWNMWKSACLYSGSYDWYHRTIIIITITIKFFFYFNYPESMNNSYLLFLLSYIKYIIIIFMMTGQYSIV